MTSETPTQSASQLRWRAISAQLKWLGMVCGAVLLALLGTSVAAITLQAGRDEARHADFILVLAPEIPPQPLIDHTLELYRRGYAARVLLVGPGQSQARDRLLDRGVPAEAIGLVPPAPSLAAWLSAATTQAGGETALVVADPSETLNILKLVQDRGLRAYGSPPSGAAPRPLDLLGAGVRYWGYVLGGAL